jgi:uncharacterized protein (DUF362 family)/NAD-dependent dihydropyrimidine dehydrogenase PreA subunit
VSKLFLKNDCKIIIGDSPFTNPEKSFSSSGLDRVAKKYSYLKRPVIFEQEKLTQINDPGAEKLKKFFLPSILKEVELVVNIPKLKTHQLTKYTGAIKNLYGCIPGGLKQRIHNEAHGDKRFSKLLVDIYQNILPELNIMDSVIGMEGDGPTSGKPKEVGLIIASKNSVALDISASRIIGYNPKKIYSVREAIRRKLYPSYKITLAGVEKLPTVIFEKPTSQKRRKIGILLKNLFREKPIVCNQDKCVRCKLCKNHCPAGAISMNPFPSVNKRMCIRCFCCIEICPQDAMMLEEEKDKKLLTREVKN